jgi:hypothetical protein
MAAVGILNAKAQGEPGAQAVCQVSGIPTPGVAIKTLPADQFAKLHAAMSPRGERWTEIPWETDLAAARQKAIRERKPLLMWVMDGHPLGCT